jgi:hypothetical protein
MLLPSFTACLRSQRAVCTRLYVSGLGSGVRPSRPLALPPAAPRPGRRRQPGGGGGESLRSDGFGEIVNWPPRGALLRLRF